MYTFFVFIIGGAVGFVLATMGAVSIINRKGWRTFDDIPERDCEAR